MRCKRRPSSAVDLLQACDVVVQLYGRLTWTGDALNGGVLANEPAANTPRSGVIPTGCPLRVRNGDIQREKRGQPRQPSAFLVHLPGGGRNAAEWTGSIERFVHSGNCATNRQRTRDTSVATSSTCIFPANMMISGHGRMMPGRRRGARPTPPFAPFERPDSPSVSTCMRNRSRIPVRAPQQSRCRRCPRISSNRTGDRGCPASQEIERRQLVASLAHGERPKNGAASMIATPPGDQRDAPVHGASVSDKTPAGSMLSARSTAGPSLVLVMVRRTPGTGDRNDAEYPAR